MDAVKRDARRWRVVSAVAALLSVTMVIVALGWIAVASMLRLEGDDVAAGKLVGIPFINFRTAGLIQVLVAVFLALLARSLYRQRRWARTALLWVLGLLGVLVGLYSWSFVAWIRSFEGVQPIPDGVVGSVWVGTAIAWVVLGVASWWVAKLR